jgi:hypothetical protein
MPRESGTYLVHQDLVGLWINKIAMAIIYKCSRTSVLNQMTVSFGVSTHVGSTSTTL